MEQYKIINYVIENYSDIGIEVHSGVNVYTINATNETNLHQTYESLSTVMASYDEIKNLKINKVLFTFSSAEQKEIFKKKLFKEIFEPGFTTKKRGWGLGLSLTKRIIEDFHNGKIKVLQSETNKGTTIQIALKRSYHG